MTSTTGRLTSLDVFRGLTIAAMIVVNNPGNWNAVYPQLSHAVWNGCTLADLVFPFFIFIMGMAMPLAFARRRDPCAGAARVTVHVWRRAAFLVGLGLILNVVAAWLHPAPVRIPGVLQRIALTYLFAALIVLRCGPGARIAIAVTLLVLQWAVLILVPFDGHAAGMLTMEQNLGSYIDRAMFGSHTLTAMGDPEGLIGLAPSVATALLGATAGEWLRHSRGASRGAPTPVIVAGLAAIAIGWLWSYALPFNKQLWTGSYVVFASGLAALGVAACYVAAEGTPRWSRPFVWLGSNPLIIYFLSEVFSRFVEQDWFRYHGQLASAKDLFFWDLLAPITRDHGGARSSLVYALIYTALWIGVAGLIDRRMRRGAPAAAAAYRQGEGARA